MPSNHDDSNLPSPSQPGRLMPHFLQRIGRIMMTLSFPPPPNPAGCSLISYNESVES